MKHTDSIKLMASNKTQAMEKVLEFLNLYNKRKIRIIDIAGKDNHYEIFAYYEDDYEDDAVYKTSDIDPDLLTTFKRNERDEFDEYVDELAGDICIDMITNKLVKHYVNTQKK